MIGRLLAERQPGAKPLPWMGVGQGGGIEGDWLLCAVFEGDAEAARALPGADIYRRLPVGRGASARGDQEPAGPHA